MSTARGPDAASASGGSEIRGQLRISLRVALVVGTLLTVINQSGLLLGRAPRLGDGLRVLLNYLVPFLVSLHATSVMRRGIPRSGGRS